MSHWFTYRVSHMVNIFLPNNWNNPLRVFVNFFSDNQEEKTFQKVSKIPRKSLHCNLGKYILPSTWVNHKWLYCSSDQMKTVLFFHSLGFCGVEFSEIFGVLVKERKFVQFPKWRLKFLMTSMIFLDWKSVTKIEPVLGSSGSKTHALLQYYIPWCWKNPSL